MAYDVLLATCEKKGGRHLFMSFEYLCNLQWNLDDKNFTTFSEIL